MGILYTCTVIQTHLRVTSGNFVPKRKALEDTPVHHKCFKVYHELVLGLKVLYFLFLSDLQSQTLHFDGADTGPRASILWAIRCIYTFENITVG